MAYTDLSSPYYNEEEESEADINGGHSSCSIFDERDDSMESPKHASVPKDPYDFDSFFDALPPDDCSKDLDKLSSLYTGKDINPPDPSSGENPLRHRSDSEKLYPAKVLTLSTQLSEDLNSPYCDEEDLSKNQNQTPSDDDDSNLDEPYNDGSEGPESPSLLPPEDAETLDSCKEDDQRSLANKSDEPLYKEGSVHLETQHVERADAHQLVLPPAVVLRLRQLSSEETPEAPPPPYIEDGEAVSDSDENQSTAPPPHYDPYDTISSEYSTLKSLFPPVTPSVLTPHKKTRSAPNVFEHMRKLSKVRSSKRSHRRSRTAFMVDDDETSELSSNHSVTYSGELSTDLLRWVVRVAVCASACGGTNEKLIDILLHEVNQHVVQKSYLSTNHHDVRVQSGCRRNG